VEIGTLILINAFRNPAIVAKMATTADEVSHGRLILGLGAGYPGYNESMYQAFGLPFERQVDRFAEALQIVRPLLKEGRVDFAGEYYHARNCEDVPRGPRAAGPPLLVGGIGPRLLKLSAQYADLWNTGYMGKPETFAGPLAKIEAACREVGRDPATLGITVLVGLWFPDLQAKRPRIFDHVLTGTAPELAAAMRGYAELGVQHIIFQCEPYTLEARQRLTAALHLYRGMGSTGPGSDQDTERR
jgi:alkanesulfonate monooxygenase SsuD/methylene tetrahydromethanopterin reductase-like flavin-dependent oxidoreductase (luciferase family)